MDSLKLTLINQTSLSLTGITCKIIIVLLYYYCIIVCFLTFYEVTPNPFVNFEVGHLIDSAVLNIKSILNKNRKITIGQ